MESTMIQVEILHKVAMITMNNSPANAISPEVREEFSAKQNKSKNS